MQVHELCNRSLGAFDDNADQRLGLMKMRWRVKLPYIWLGCLATVMDSHKCQSLYLSQAPVQDSTKVKSVKTIIYYKSGYINHTREGDKTTHRLI